MQWFFQSTKSCNFTELFTSLTLKRGLTYHLIKWPIPIPDLWIWINKLLIEKNFICKEFNKEFGILTIYFIHKRPHVNISLQIHLPSIHENLCLFEENSHDFLIKLEDEVLRTKNVFLYTYNEEKTYLHRYISFRTSWNQMSYDSRIFFCDTLL